MELNLRPIGAPSLGRERTDDEQLGNKWTMRRIKGEQRVGEERD